MSMDEVNEHAAECVRAVGRFLEDNASVQWERYTEV